jgi:hypothetical protein
MGLYDWTRPTSPLRQLGYRIALLLLLVGLGLEIGGIAGRDIWFAFSGLLVIALGATVAVKSAWRSIRSRP